MRHVFPCGIPALDFVGTLQERRTPVPLERIGSPALLDSWLVQAGLLDRHPGSDRADLCAALELREAIYALVSARLTGCALPVKAVITVNRQAAGVPVVMRLGVAGSSRSGKTAQALTDLARQAVEILAGDDATLLRECGRTDCTHVYLDRSRGRRREWCAMRTCGNRVKAAALRARRRA
ncbi:predicted RNA-binding Zn ribbon-like protein [Streptomyces sp. TLI_55]|uniref:CGNR zinc finger domain-containing protein n=1 Tax=Streptomyces sp. TLI_55 TaxID=1938861 RepID=UPI000BD621AB|nr:ABATE domain-containing protein [Streptomyces sp. TLI_55]SNX88334.1 predicted RNA-binding Zn ribbon-like protein [Streptomyces sp. TLI_55]